MYEARQNKEKVSRRIDSGGSGMARQRVKMSKFSSKVIQKAAEISMDYNGKTYNGQSSKDTETYDNMSYHPAMLSFFKNNIKSKVIKVNSINEQDDDDWTFIKDGTKEVYTKTRDWKHCAEPNAFSKFVKAQKKINSEMLASCNFPHLTIYKGEKKAPCDVCEQWVELFGNGLKLRNNIISEFKGGKESFAKTRQKGPTEDFTNGKVITWGKKLPQ